MDYTSWNLRGISFFKEEIIDLSDEKINSYPSIKAFQQNGFYTPEIREKLCDYLENCPAIVSTSYRRLNAYTLEPTFSLTYFADGDFIFTNLLQEYIQYDNFVLPQKWYELIKTRDYLHEGFELNIEKMVSGEIDVFKNFERSFDEASMIRKVIL
ncbi:hypothetical protein [Chryseobacterium herbae]|uniref:Uncharacterized protein n=1 Tax=Chryseobacterium herbae TaxID=2976476 RepID=A0ABT2IXA3_9FLAO|nr:hypothetical protein [Chryseobacterium sp. pc1-10]MCT2563417.1 hypothetical protein [Chryseobacterium sp. pc1-10]